jgi:hypothetical protein
VKGKYELDEQSLIFLSYASPDRERVLEYYSFLTRQGQKVWMDKHDIKGGQNWDFEIKRALSKATMIIVFLSNNSVNRRGYAQREIKIALDQSKDKLSDDIYIIPVMLETDAGIPTELSRTQVLRPEDGNVFDLLLEAIHTQLQRIRGENERIQSNSEVRWTINSYKDSWHGLPGYDSEYDLIRFYSSAYPQVSEITDVIRGRLTECAMSERYVKFEQSSDFHNFGKSRFQRQNTWDASCGDPKIVERVISIQYNIWHYGAGAAHPNSGFLTFAFTLDPVTQISRIQDIFEDPDSAFVIIQKTVRDLLLAPQNADTEDNQDSFILDKKMVKSGTNTWDDFRNFVFEESEITFLFGHYQVAPFVSGLQSASVQYSAIAAYLKEHFACALGIEWDRRRAIEVLASPS